MLKRLTVDDHGFQACGPYHQWAFTVLEALEHTYAERERGQALAQHAVDAAPARAAAGEMTAITSDMDAIDCADVEARIETLEVAEIDAGLTPAQSLELAALRDLVRQVQHIDADDYFVPVLYREGVQPPAGPSVDEFWVMFGGTRYLIVSSHGA
ncbi:hypothetical protein ACOTHA_29485 [Achromobacter xylosoxidans]